MKLAAQRQYKNFGHTDLKVTRLCQGTAFRHLPRATDPRSRQVLEHCLELGVNFFDSSNAYGWGGAEEVLGQALAGKRDRAIICTKVAASEPDDQPDTYRPARFTDKFLRRQLDSSLQRLGTDYIDLYLLHQPDKVSTEQEIIPSLEALVQEGKIRHWGVSNHPPASVQTYADLTRNGPAPVAGTEDYYNIAGSHLHEDGQSRVQWLEDALFPVLRQENLGLLAFSPLDTGNLTPGREAEADPSLIPLIAALDQAASELDVTRASICVAWVLSHPEVSSVLAGSESPEQVEENLLGAELELPPELLARLNQASQDYKDRQQADS
jgi:aryl-alcohol dehydrogenase-like predicted oxidoreductase